MVGDRIGDAGPTYGQLTAAGDATGLPAGQSAYRDALLTAGMLLLSVLLLSLFGDQLDWPHSLFLNPAWHTLLEVFSISVSVLIFAIGWNTFRSGHPAVIIVIAYAFLGVAILDVFHSLSFPGMPDWVTPSGYAKSIHFWLAGRLLAAAVLLYASAAPWDSANPGLGWRILLLPVLLLVGGISYTILFLPERLPVMFVHGQGVSDLKSWCEYSVMALNLLAAGAFLARINHSGSVKAERFFLAAFSMALSESFFVFYPQSSGLTNVVGHVYKMLAYLFLYRAIFVELVRAPYLRLEQSRRGLHITRNQFEAILNSAPDGVVVIDRATRIVHANPRFAIMFGHSLQELPGMGMAALLPQFALVGVEPQWQPGLAGAGFACRMDALHCDGNVFPVELSVSPVADSSGESLLIAIVRDISAQAAMLESLRASEARFRGYVENTPDWIWELDAQGYFRYSSPRVGEILGYAPHELIGKSFVSFPAVPDDDGGEALVEALRRGQQVNALQLQRLHRDGQPVFLEISCIPDLGSNGVLQGVRCIGRDITQRRHNEQLLQQSEMRLRQAFDYASLGIALVSIDWRLLRVNPALAALAGLAEKACLQLSLRALVHPDDVEMLQRYMDRLDGYVKPRPVEVRLLHRRGNYLWVSITAGWVPGAAGAAGHYVVQFIDVSQRREDEQRIRLLSSILDQTRDFVCMADPGGRIEYLNPSARHALGIAMDEALGDLSLTDLHPAATARLLLSRILPEVERTGFWEGETAWQTRDGQSIPTLQTMQVHRNGDGHVEYWSAIAHDISERKRFESQLMHQATHDALTGLPNRSLLHDRLEMAMAGARRKNCLLAVMFIDLDEFKQINELYGHKFGDQLLEKVSKRLRGGLRESDTLARQGGDSFVAVLADIRFMQDMIELAEKILSTLAIPFQVAQRDVFVAASIGISVFPLENDSSEELLRKADVAVCRAKAQGRNCYQFYTADMDDEVLHSIELEADLRRALSRDELAMHFQPQIDIVSGQITGAEALIRWRHPLHGMISPAEFIPLAEKSSFIFSIGEWTLNQACLAIASLAPRCGPDFRIAVNLSAQQLLQGDLLSLVRDTLARHAVPAAALELEITETAMIQDPDTALDVLLQLHDLGVSIALDDFGTGYSSLVYLKHFPVDVLKIDRTFVADIGHDADDLAIVSAVVQLAYKLQMKVVAEGVETAQQCELLQANGCPLMQGYFFARPMPFDDFERLLAAGQPLHLPVEPQAGQGGMR